MYVQCTLYSMYSKMKNSKICTTSCIYQEKSNLMQIFLSPRKSVKTCFPLNPSFKIGSKLLTCLTVKKKKLLSKWKKLTRYQVLKIPWIWPKKGLHSAVLHHSQSQENNLILRIKTINHKYLQYTVNNST